MNTIEGIFNLTDVKIAIVAGRFNEFIVNQLVEGSLEALRKHSIKTENVDLIKVPGAFEIPLAADKAAASKKYDAVICLGAVIKGATAHFDFVASGAANGIAQVGLKYSLPVIFGVLTTDTIEQAIERAGTKAGNKGYDCAMAALEMISVLKQI